MKIRFWSEDGFDVTINCEFDEWEQLTAEARENNWPIDGSTVDHNLLDELLMRQDVVGKADEEVQMV